MEPRAASMLSIHSTAELDPGPVRAPGYPLRVHFWRKAGQRRDSQFGPSGAMCVRSHQFLQGLRIRNLPVSLQPLDVVSLLLGLRKASAKGLCEPQLPAPPAAQLGPSTHLLFPGFGTFLQQPRATFPSTVLVLAVLHERPEAAHNRKQASGQAGWPLHEAPKLTLFIKPTACSPKAQSSAVAVTPCNR